MNEVEKAVVRWCESAEKPRSRQELAKELNCTRQSVWRWERLGWVPERYALTFSRVTGCNPWLISKLAKQMAA